MATTFTLSVVAPDRLVAEVEITSVSCPGIDGYFGVMANHMPLVTALKPGLVEYTDASNQRHAVVVDGGFAEVTGKKVSILADSATKADEIEYAKVEAILEEARKALRGEPSSIAAGDAPVEIDKAIARLRVAKK